MKLARSFPALASAPLSPWDPDTLDRWASQLRLVEQRIAAQLVLHVFDRTIPWQCGPFDAKQAQRIFEGKDLEGLQRWRYSPWWL